MHYNRHYDNPSVMGLDSETVTGMPYTLQFWQPNYQKIMFVNSENVTRRFLSLLEALPDKRLILFVYYSKFDLPILLFPYLHYFSEDGFDLKIQGWQLKVFCSKNYWASLYHAKTGKYVQIIDIFNFFKGGLDKVAKDMKVGIRKLKRPANIGEYAFSRKDKKYIRYAMQDAQVAYELGKMIAKHHKEFDIPVSLSAPKMAELIFRKHFLNVGDEYLLPETEKCLSYSLHCYHGAKNAYYLDHPAFFRKIFDYDIISAYPFAMSILPSFLTGRYRAVAGFYPDVLNRPGVYFLHAKLKPCRYGIFSTMGFRYIREGGTVKIFATGYEILEALRAKELEILYINGFVFESTATRNPLQEYVRYFYEHKKKAKNKSASYELYKLLLNSLYGKWVQTNPVQQEKIEVGEDLSMKLLPASKVAAGLFNPFIASQITGFIRAELHRLEHKYHAIETSTDSFKTRKEITFRHKQSLGGLELKFAGSGLFCRSRLNLLLDGRKIKGCALHGFWGTAKDLYNLYASQSTTYLISRMPLVRESLLHRGKQAFIMHDEVRELNVNWRKLKHYDV